MVFHSTNIGAQRVSSSSPVARRITGHTNNGVLADDAQEDAFRKSQEKYGLIYIYIENKLKRLYAEIKKL